MERIERRLDALEARFAAPPPVVRTPHMPVYAPPPATPEPPRADDLESLIGSRWLPRAGAAAIVSALAYLVKLGLDRGVITPAAVVVGIALACLAVIGLGLRLKDEREAFGHVLVGIGIGGLYVDAVGAHFAQGVLGAEAMVASCLLVSLVTLGYGFWRALPSFLGIGLFGGLIAAAMPLSKGLSPMPVVLFLLVAAPAFAVVAVRRWALVAMGVWASCTVASVGFLYAQGPLALRLVPLDAALLLALAAWAWAADPLPDADPQGAFPFVAATVSGILALGAWNGLHGAAHAALLGVAVAALGLAFPKRPAGPRLRDAGLALTLALAPLGLQPIVAAAVLAGLAVGLALVLAASRRPRGGAAGVLVAAQTALAVGEYGVALATNAAFGRYEIGLILSLGAAVVAAAWALDLKEARVGAGVVVWGLATRLAVVGFDLPANVAVSAAWIATFVVLLAVGFARRLPELRQLGLAVAAATATKVVLVDLSGLDPALKAAILLGLGLMLLVGGYAYVRAGRTKGNLGG